MSPGAQKGVGVDGSTWTWDYFLVPQNEATPAASALGMFSPLHLGVLGLLTLGIALLVVRYRAADVAGRRRIRLQVASTLLLLEVLRQLAYVLTGAYTADIVPLHVCGISVFVIMVDATIPNRWTGDFLYALGWWGALAAVVFPDWANRPLLNVFTWQSFAAHALILGYVLMLLVGGDLVPTVRNLGRVALMVTGFGTVAALANRAWGTNFWFLAAGAPGSPLEAIQSVAGGAYVPVLVVLLAVLVTVLYLPWSLRAAPRTSTGEAELVPARPLAPRET